MAQTRKRTRSHRSELPHPADSNKQKSASVNSVGNDEEYHSEPSLREDAGGEQDEQDEEDIVVPQDEGSNAAASGLLLPSGLLQSAPATTRPAPSRVRLPRDQLTPKQKKTERNRSRQYKKRMYDRIREAAAGTPTLEAGRVAQVKRRGHAQQRREGAGRVEKRTKTESSGRQKLLEERKRTLVQRPSIARPVGKAKTKRKG